MSEAAMIVAIVLLFSWIPILSIGKAYQIATENRTKKDNTVDDSIVNEEWGDAHIV